MAKKASRKKAAPKKAAKKAPKKAAKRAGRRPQRGLNTIAMAHALEVANTVDGTDGEPVGACMIIHPGTGRIECRQYTRQQCADVGGEWQGGPC